jgi:hypothetical protein
MTTFQDIIEQINNLKSMQQYNTNKQNLTNSNGFGHGIANLGMNMSQSSIPAISKLGVGTQTLGNNLGALGSGISKAAPAATALGKATPFLGAGMSGAQAAQDAKNGDYIGAGLNGISAGASFVPGIGTAVSMGASMLDSINKAVRSAQDKANAKAMQISAQEAQKSEQNNAQDTAQLQNQFANDSMQYANAMAQPSTYDAMKTQLPVGQEIGYQVAKDNSPFANDSGYDYDLRGAYQRLGGLNPEATNGHLSDYDKLPIHPTFSTDSKFYNGQNYAVDPSTHQYLPNTAEEILSAISSGTQSQPAAQSTQQSLMNKIRNGLSQFKQGYDDNSQHGFMEGDLANKLAVNTQQPVTPSPYEQLGNDMIAANYSPEQIAAAKQGLNGGNADIAALVDKYSINKPTNDEEIALARAGNFNPQEITGAAAPLQGGVAKKSLMNRIGEAAGTGRRLLANPWVQAGIAGIVTKATGGTNGDALLNAYNYGKEKQMSDYYYKQLNPGANVTPIINGFGATDYKNQADIENANARLQEQIYNDEFTRQLNQDKFNFDKDYKNKKLDLDERKHQANVSYRNRQIGLQGQRLQVALANAKSKAEKDRIKRDYEAKIQEDIAKYSQLSDEDKKNIEDEMINEYGVQIIDYMKKANSISGNKKQNNGYPPEANNKGGNEPSLYDRLPGWFTKGWKEKK